MCTIDLKKIYHKTLILTISCAHGNHRVDANGSAFAELALGTYAVGPDFKSFSRLAKNASARPDRSPSAGVAPSLPASHEAILQPPIRQFRRPLASAVALVLAVAAAPGRQRPGNSFR